MKVILVRPLLYLLLFFVFDLPYLPARYRYIHCLFYAPSIDLFLSFFFQFICCEYAVLSFSWFQTPTFTHLFTYSKNSVLSWNKHLGIICIGGYVLHGTRVISISLHYLGFWCPKHLQKRLFPENLVLWIFKNSFI